MRFLIGVFGSEREALIESGPEERSWPVKRRGVGARLGSESL